VAHWSNTARVRSSLEQDSLDRVQLVRQAQYGDRAAFLALVKEYDRLVIRLALGMTQSETEAQRIHQEVFLRAFKGLPALEHGTSLFIWICRLAVKVCIEHRRKREAAGNVSRPELRLVSRDLSAAQQAFAHRVGHALDRLSTRERLVFELRHYHSIKLATVAEILEISEGSVADALTSATQKLRAATSPNSYS